MAKSSYSDTLAELQEPVIELVLLVLTVFVFLVLFRLSMHEAAAFCMVLLVFYLPGLVFYCREKGFIERHLINFVTGLSIVGVFMYVLAAIIAYL